jgi:hypothetical protein
MIESGVPKSPSLNKSAVTRFNNDRVEASQATMVGNPAAQASLRTQVQNKANRRSPTAPMPAAPNVNRAVGNVPQAIDRNADFDPSVFQEVDPADALIGEIKLKKFLGSPEVKDATTAVDLKEKFNRGNARATPDPRPVLQQVIGRMKIK